MRSFAVLLFLFLPGVCFAASPATTTKVTAAILATSTVRVPAPYASVDNTETLSLQTNPFLAGSAANLQGPLTLKIIAPAQGLFKDTLWYQNLAVLVANGRWGVTVFPAIPRGVYRTELRSSGALLSTSTLLIGLPTQPLVDSDSSLAGFDVADGRLLHFKITARGAGEISIAKLTFTIETENAGLDSLTLSAFSDPGYLQPAVGSTTDPTVAAVEADPADSTGTRFIAALDTPLVIPNGTTYYFELAGTVTPSDANYDAATTLLGDDGALSVDTEVNMATTSNFVWSPDLSGEASTTNADWTNSVASLGFVGRGPTVVRTNAPGAPICSLNLSTSTTAVGRPVVATWSSSNATYAINETGGKELPQGSKSFTSPAATHTYVLTFYGQNGTTTCFATLVIPQPFATSTGNGGQTATSTATTTPGSFVASSTASSLKVGFGGSVNNSKSCVAATWSFGFGDKATSTITVPANTCKPVNFYFSHTYAKAGTYLAILATSTGANNGQVLQRKSVVVPTVTTYSNAASVIGAWSGQVYGVFKRLGHWLFGW